MGEEQVGRKEKHLKSEIPYAPLWVTRLTLYTWQHANCFVEDTPESNKPAYYMNRIWKWIVSLMQQAGTLFVSYIDVNQLAWSCICD